jgi:5-methylcytosine-specific restriction endonuclease McrA
LQYRSEERNATERDGERFKVRDIYDRDRWVCGICNGKVDKRLKYPHPMSASLDHIIPLAKGGTHTRDNVQLAHLVCNSKAGAGGVKQLRLFG